MKATVSVMPEVTVGEAKAHDVATTTLFFFDEMLERRLDVFFFQAEDGIRDRNVTGVQTCALPISSSGMTRSPSGCRHCATAGPSWMTSRATRSEERRVGKECRSRWSPYH